MTNFQTSKDKVLIFECEKVDVASRIKPIKESEMLLMRSKYLINSNYKKKQMSETKNSVKSVINPEKEHTLLSSFTSSYENRSTLTINREIKHQTLVEQIIRLELDASERLFGFSVKGGSDSGSLAKIYSINSGKYENKL